MLNTLPLLPTRVSDAVGLRSEVGKILRFCFPTGFKVLLVLGPSSINTGLRELETKESEERKFVKIRLLRIQPNREFQPRNLTINECAT